MAPFPVGEVGTVPGFVKPKAMCAAGAVACNLTAITLDLPSLQVSAGTGLDHRLRARQAETHRLATHMPTALPCPAA